MASSDKTQNYKLNIWEHGDKPNMEDFNQDNQIIEQELGKRVTNQAFADKMSLLEMFVNTQEAKFNDDANSYTKVGTYYLHATSIAETMANLPVKTAGKIYVYPSAYKTFNPNGIWQYALQVYISHEGLSVYKRTMQTGQSANIVFGPWTKF